jgi:serine/threonine protein kinase
MMDNQPVAIKVNKKFHLEEFLVLV